MSRPSASPALQLYLFAACLLAVIVVGTAGTFALAGAVRLSHPKLLLDRHSWDEFTSFDRYRAAYPAAPDTHPEVLSATWQRHRRDIIRVERHLGQRQLLIGAIAASVACVLLILHWWLALRLGARTDSRG